MADRLYLDWNASAPPSTVAVAAAMQALAAGGNASSIHAEGRASRGLIERARRALAMRFGVAPHDVVFTSGGTEANATALSPGVSRPGGPACERLLVSAVEHPAVLAGGRFHPRDVTTVPVDGNGVIHLDALDAALSQSRPAMVSVMAANNETGVIQPLAEIAAIARSHGAVVHSDAVQAFGRVPDTMLCADLVTVSGHKIGAPTGVGALIRRGVDVPPLVRGGGQERGARGGTENVAAIAGMAAALAGPAADPLAWVATARARDDFEAALLDFWPKVTIFGQQTPRLANTSLFALGAPAELALIGLDLAGVAVSSGSACSSGRVSVSHVLLAMGVAPETARCAIRVSVGPTGAAEGLGRFLVALRQVIVPMGA